MSINKRVMKYIWIMWTIFNLKALVFRGFNGDFQGTLANVILRDWKAFVATAI